MSLGKHIHEFKNMKIRYDMIAKLTSLNQNSNDEEVNNYRSPYNRMLIKNNINT